MKDDNPPGYKVRNGMDILCWCSSHITTAPISPEDPRCIPIRGPCHYACATCGDYIGTSPTGLNDSPGTPPLDLVSELLDDYFPTITTRVQTEHEPCGCKVELGPGVVIPMDDESGKVLEITIPAVSCSPRHTVEDVRDAVRSCGLHAQSVHQKGDSLHIQIKVD